MAKARIAAALLLTALLVPASAIGQEPRYRQWDRGSSDANTLIDDLHALINKAEDARAADPAVLADMRATLRRHAAGNGTLFQDDFADGDFTRNPVWRVQSGQFHIDRRFGLRSRVGPTNMAAAPQVPGVPAVGAYVPPTANTKDGRFGPDLSSPAKAISSGDIGRIGAKANAFDDNPDTYWTSDRDGRDNEFVSFIGQTFQSDSAKHVRAVRLVQKQGSRNGNANSVEVQRHADGRWQTVADFAVVPDGRPQVLQLPPSGPAAQWRVLATSTNALEPNAFWQVAELEFMELAPAQLPSAPVASDRPNRPTQSTLQDLGTAILRHILPPGQSPTANNLVMGAPSPSQMLTLSMPPSPNLLLPAAAAQPAQITTAVALPDSFEMDLVVYAFGDMGEFTFGPYQASVRNAGYRLRYSPGSTPSLTLLRMTRRGIRVIDSYDGALPARQDEPLPFKWLRRGDGVMSVSVDGKELIRTRDTDVRNPFKGFVLVNKAGDFALRSIEIRSN